MRDRRRARVTGGRVLACVEASVATSDAAAVWQPYERLAEISFD
jgi:hypothetical protein